jgi:hypothetical protein
MFDWGEVAVYVVSMGGGTAIFGIYCLIEHLVDEHQYKKRDRKNREDYERYQYEQEMENAWKELLNTIGGKR